MHPLKRKKRITSNYIPLESIPQYLSSTKISKLFRFLVLKYFIFYIKL